MIEDTTAKKDNANKVVGLKVENITFSSANVSWVPPISPNGPVLKYVVFISNVTEDFKHSMYVLQHCVSPCGSNRSLDEYYPLEDLRPGTMYRVKVEAHSRAPLDMNDTIATADFTTKVNASPMAEDSEDHGQMLLVVAVFLLLAVMSGIFVFRRVQLPKPSVDEDVDPGFKQAHSDVSPYLLLSNFFLSSVASVWQAGTGAASLGLVYVAVIVGTCLESNGKLSYNK
ncbi:hypothetical protein E2C01_040319 [Portunus trituberculatus]|uniref:Fibronectin type-III domain-containing protein n=1 Tax=Portunus trituberculatus TaxID=210409 RepID=A0A5B7FMP2_PORTR|nr:hypothetical protein [Portunus trituberculatus]